MSCGQARHAIPRRPDSDARGRPGYPLNGRYAAAPATSAINTSGSGWPRAPVTTALLCYLKTQSGRAFFETATVNKELRRVVRAWSLFLSSPESLTVISNGTFGWMSPCALTIVNMTEFQYDADAPHWGFSSWSAFFTRPLRAGARGMPLCAPRPTRAATSRS